MKPLNGKVALVTGGSRGIGAAIALQLAEQGADVAITYAQSAEKAERVGHVIKERGQRAIAIQADASNVTDVEDAVDKTVAELGGLDILVNNAGIFEVGNAGDLTNADFDRTVAVNVRAPFVATNAAAKKMRPGGSVVFIGSTLASRVPEQGLSLYSMSKSALVGMAKGLARDLGERQITVNLVHPGPTDTDMNPASGPGAEDQKGALTFGRFNEPREVASLVNWLAGPDARNVTGAEFTIDGGSNA